MRRDPSSSLWDNAATVARPLPFLPRKTAFVAFDDSEPDYDDAETLRQRPLLAADPILAKTRSVPAMKTYRPRAPSVTPPMQALPPIAMPPEQEREDKNDRSRLVGLGASYGVQGIWVVVVAVTLLAFMKIIPAAFARFDSIATAIHTK